MLSGILLPAPLLAATPADEAPRSGDHRHLSWTQELSVHEALAREPRSPDTDATQPLSEAFLAAAAETEASDGPSSDSASVWGFDDLAEAAVRHYPAITASLRQQDAARSDREAAGWQRFPTPAVQASSDDDITQAVLSLEQPLWTGGRITAGIEAAESRLGASREQVGGVRQDILQRVIDAYAEASRRTAQLEIAARNVDELSDLQQMIERRVRQMASPQADLELASSRLAQAVAERVAIAQALRSSLAQLSELSGQEVSAVAPSSAAEDPGLAATLSEAQREALSHSPQLAQLGFQQQAAKADTRGERAARFPSLALRLEQRENRGGGIAAPERSDTRVLMVMESNFGAGLSTLASIDAASSRQQSLEQEREAALRELRSEVADLWHQREAAGLRLDSAEQTRLSAERVSASYNRQYAIGQKSWLDLMNAVREASSAGLAVEDARADVFRASWRLATLIGSAQVAALSPDARDPRP